MEVLGILVIRMVKSRYDNDERISIFNVLPNFFEGFLEKLKNSHKRSLDDVWLKLELDELMSTELQLDEL